MKIAWEKFVDDSASGHFPDLRFSWRASDWLKTIATIVTIMSDSCILPKNPSFAKTFTYG